MIVRRKRNRRLVLHIGTAKTATSTIQYSLDHAREQLRGQGVCYPSTVVDGHPDHRNHHALAKALAARGEWRRHWERWQAEFERSGCHTLVLSSERFARWDSAYDEFLSFVAASWDLTTLVVLRRQDLFAESFWAWRTVAGFEQGSILEFTSSQLFGRLADYPGLLRGFSVHGEVVALEFEEFARNGPVEEVSRALGVGGIPTVEARNVTPGMQAVLALGQGKRLGLSIDRERLIRSLEHDPTRHVLGIDDRRRLLERFEPDNRRLRVEYGLSFGTDLPAEPERTLLDPDPEVVDIRAFARD